MATLLLEKLHIPVCLLAVSAWLAVHSPLGHVGDGGGRGGLCRGVSASPDSRLRSDW